MDTKLRTFIKTFSYRVLAALSIYLLSVVLDYPSGFGVKLVVITMTVGFALFYIHERVWNRITWLKELVTDTVGRSVVKTVSWRIVSLVVLFIIGMLLGLSSNDALYWTVASNIMFVTLHYLHERAWNRITWGRIVSVE